MIDRLITLADYLDLHGHHKEASRLDSLLKKVAQDTVDEEFYNMCTENGWGGCGGYGSPEMLAEDIIAPTSRNAPEVNWEGFDSLEYVNEYVAEEDLKDYLAVKKELLDLCSDGDCDDSVLEELSVIQSDIANSIFIGISDWEGNNLDPNLEFIASSYGPDVSWCQYKGSGGSFKINLESPNDKCWPTLPAGERVKIG